MAYNRIKCPMCEKDFGQEKRFLEHLTQEHGFDRDVEQLYVDSVLGGIKPLCECGCGKPTKWSGWKKGYTSKFLRGHNAQSDSCFNDPNKQKNMANKRKEGFATGRLKVWNTGLTKETNESIRSQSEKVGKTLKKGYASGKIVAWQTGLTKETNDSVKKISETRKKGYASGKIKNWSTGLTKETDDRLAKISEIISEKYKSREMGNRLSIEDVGKRIKKHNNKFELVSNVNDYVTRRVSRLEFKCKTCNKIQQKSLAMLEDTPVCFHCHPKESKGQLEVYEYVKSLIPEHDVLLSDRNVISPKELDIYVPSKNVAFEYNGLYWHSEAINEDQKHNQNKLELCIKNNVSLLTIFEDEWRDKQEIVKSMIRHRLGVDVVKLNARKLRCDIIPTKEAKEFFNSAHLEGYVPSKVSFGLYHEDTLVAAMSLRRPFHRRYSDSLEVGRCATKPGYNVRGWLGKLTSRAKKFCKDNDIKSMMTYVDSRVGSGIGYERAGWEIIGNTGSPRFWWTDFENRFNRFKYKADKSRNMTQEEIAIEAGVVKIWGCSNSRWALKIT